MIMHSCLLSPSQSALLSALPLLSPTEAFPMKSGDGPQRYAQNSSYQVHSHSSLPPFQSNLITQHKIYMTYDIYTYNLGNGCDHIFGHDKRGHRQGDALYRGQLLSWATFQIADLGYSSGPNTFVLAHELVESMGLKYEAHGPVPPDFKVLFNDPATNDFTPSSPPSPPGIFPGGFHGPLFPRSSLHPVYSSYTLLWLFQVPVSVIDGTCSAWNGGRIYLTGAPEMVGRAYEDQYKEDIGRFLGARAEDVVGGVCMALVVACVGDGVAKGGLALG